jgi:hypothetical protein
VSRAGPPIFLHIPKTAGTSLRELLSHMYGGERCLFLYGREFEGGPDTLAALRRDAGRAAVVYGHMPFGVHEALGLRPFYVAVLRNPVERVVSFFRHQERDRQSEYHEQIAAGMSMVDLLRSGRCHQVDNHMTRMLSGRDSPHSAVDRTALDDAMGNLQAHFGLVGLTEHMEETVVRLGRRLEWGSRPIAPLPVLNVDPRPPPPLPEVVREVIMRHNALDVELYDRVSEAFAAEDSR